MQDVKLQMEKLGASEATDAGGVRKRNVVSSTHDLDEVDD